MILDAFVNAMQYRALGARLECALRYLTTTDFSRLAPGRHDVDGTRVFALVSEYETKPLEHGAWEAHRQHIDVQYLQSGEERVRYASLATLRTLPYDAENDLLRAEGGPGELFLLKPDRFVILFPQDAHAPGLVADTPQRVRKVVIKVAV